MTRSVQPLVATTRPWPVDGRLERAGDGRADRDDAAAAGLGGVDGLRGDGRDAKRSACGASPASCEDRPVCRVIGLTATPLLISRVTRSVVNGRAADGISALPGSMPKTVW